MNRFFDEQALGSKRFIGTFAGAIIPANHVFTMANGDSVFARSEGTAEFDGRRFRNSTAQWTFEAGTGKFQGLKGSGTPTCHPGPGGYACQAEGQHTLPAS